MTRVSWTAVVIFAIACAGPAAALPPDASPTLAPATGLPETATASPGPASSASPMRLFVHGQVLSFASGYLVFTTGQAVRLAPGVTVPQHAPLGILVRATLDPATHSVVALAFQPRASLPDEIDASHLDRAYIVSSVQSLPRVTSASENGSPDAQVTITIRVTVPDNTPQSDDVYLATDRSNYGSAEVRMQRTDLHRWTVQISLKSGTSLQYEFTRGFNTTVERDRSGGLITPRAVTVSQGLTTDDTVARWSDIQ